MFYLLRIIIYIQRLKLNNIVDKCLKKKKKTNNIVH